MATESVRFGKFVLDLSRYELTCSGQAIHLERIPMDLLVLLVRENGRLIGRDEIIEQLWGNGLHFDTDNSINTPSEKSARLSETTPESHNISKQSLAKAIASRVGRFLRRFKQSLNSLASCSQCFPSKI